VFNVILSTVYRYIRQWLSDLL